MNTLKTTHSAISMFLAVMKYAKPYKVGFLFSILLLIADIIYDVGYAWVQQWFIDAAGDRDMDRLIILTAVCLAVGIAIICFFMIQFYLRNSVQSFMARDLSSEVFEKIGSLTYQRLLHFHSGDLVTRVTRDVQQANGMISNILYELVYNIALFVVAFGYLVSINWKMALLVVASAPVVFAIGRLFDKHLRSLGQIQQQQGSNIRGLLQEMVQGIAVVRIFGLEKIFSDKYVQKREEQNRLNVKNTLIRTSMNESVHITNQILSIVIAIFTGYIAINGEITAGQVLAVLVLITRVQNPLLSVINTWGNFQQGLGAGDRLFTLFDESSEQIKGVSGAETVMTTISAAEEVRGQGSTQPAIQLRNVSVSIASDNGETVLVQNVDLSVSRGEYVAIVGPSGAGKSTLARMCCGLINLTSGQIEILGLTINDHLAEVRRRVTYVPQIPYLFSGTIQENILLGVEDASEEEIIWAAKVAQAHDFIMATDDGYKTVVSERGTSLSGGQRQRIALARALLRRSEILILDESTSALDTQTERAVINSLKENFPHVTIISIAHRMAAVTRADRIVTMAEGTIIEMGTHSELMSTNGVYASLFHGQTSQDIVRDTR